MRFLAFVALKSLQTPRRLTRYTVEEASGVLVWSGKLYDQHRKQNGVWRRASSKLFWRRASSKISTTSFSITSQTPKRQRYRPLVSRLLVENKPDDPEQATWKALTLPTNALPGNPFYSSTLEEKFWSQNPTFLLSDENIPSPECNVSFLVTKPSYIQAMCHQPWVTNLLFSNTQWKQTTLHPSHSTTKKV
jgi:hypothetical protein